MLNARLCARYKFLVLYYYYYHAGYIDRVELLDVEDSRLVVQVGWFGVRIDNHLRCLGVGCICMLHVLTVTSIRHYVTFIGKFHEVGNEVYKKLTITQPK